MAIQCKGERLGVFETRRHYTNYFRGIAHFKDYRTRLVSTMDPKEILAILDEVSEKFGNYEFV